MLGKSHLKFPVKVSLGTPGMSREQLSGKCHATAVIYYVSLLY